jgi:hypothetical protein
VPPSILTRSNLREADMERGFVSRFLAARFISRSAMQEKVEDL